LHAASDYDNGQIHAKGKRQVYFHEANDDTLDTYDETHSDSEPFDIDTPVETILEYASNYLQPPIEAIIMFVYECPNIDSLALMIKPRPFGIV
jgi:hypothetical protein